jgi:hypothetical protein
MAWVRAAGTSATWSRWWPSSQPRAAMPASVAAARKVVGPVGAAAAGSQSLVQLDRPGLLEQVDQGRCCRSRGRGGCRRRRPRAPAGPISRPISSPTASSPLTTPRAPSWAPHPGPCRGGSGRHHRCGAPAVRAGPLGPEVAGRVALDGEAAGSPPRPRTRPWPAGPRRSRRAGSSRRPGRARSRPAGRSSPRTPPAAGPARTSYVPHRLPWSSTACCRRRVSRRFGGESGGSAQISSRHQQFTSDYQYSASRNDGLNADGLGRTVRSGERAPPVRMQGGTDTLGFF